MSFCGENYFIILELSLFISLSKIPQLFYTIFSEAIGKGTEVVVPEIVSPAFRNGLVDTKLSGLRKRFFEKPLISTDF